uniref:Uncharacterized protein n=1 Tax=Chenopodium quinoa TaxID=63459 RepID=A0A803LGM6_CHEQI
MPEEMRNLTSLIHLDIRGCRMELKKRCKNPNGADWPNIQHIPNIGGLSLVQTILQVFGSPIWTEIESVLGVQSQLEKLKLTMSTIQDVLLDAEEQERRHHVCPSHVERGILVRLKEALYQADDLFDEVTTFAHRKKLMPGNKLSKEVSRFCSCFNQLRSDFIWSREIKSIREELDDVVNDHQLACGIRHSVDFVDSRVRNNPRETHSHVNLENDVIIGRDDDKRLLIDTLLDTTVEENVSVVSIVGIGGLGKTTLAQLVYNDYKIKREFPLKMWVCVSDNFNVKALAGQILAAATDQVNQSDGFTMDQLQIKLRERLDRSKYLLVLDDVWNENSEVWRTMKILLVGGGKGSRVLVTTRSKKVAVVMGSCWTHELKGLSDEESWNLFQRMTLEPEQHQTEANLVDIGKEIVRKCATVPLAIRVIGRLLRGQDESQWQNLKNNLENIIQDEANGIIPVLKISYNYLPFHLKSCFSYCAVFPKDYKIIKEDLICRWMAQGFIMPYGESFEDAGDKYFEQLLQSTRNFNKKTRHVYMDETHESTPEDIVGLEELPSGIGELVHLRTLPRELRKLVNLRHLDIYACWKLTHMPPGMNSMTSLQKLTMFAVSGGATSNAAWSWRSTDGVGQLEDLDDFTNYTRTMKIIVNEDVRYDAVGRGMLLKSQNLREIWYFWKFAYNNTEVLLQALKPHSNLRNLRFTCYPGVRLPTWTMNLKSCLPNLAKIEIRDCKRLEHLPMMSQLRHLKVLGLKELHGVEYMESSSINNGDDNELVFFPSLEKLKLIKMANLKGWWKPSTLFVGSSMNLKSCLLNLVEIVISDCNRVEQLPLMSHLRHLKVLKLYTLEELEYIENSSYINSGDEDELVFFPSLKTMWLTRMPKLKGWWKPSSELELEESETPQAPKLSGLEIEKCPELTAFPLCPGLQQLYLEDFNEALGPIIRETTQQKEEGLHGSLRTVDIDNKMKEFKTGEVGEVFRSGRLSSLRSLDIWRCYNLKSISGRGVWDHFTALESLSLRFLYELELEDEDDVINNKSTEEGCIHNNNEGSDAEMPWRYLAPTLRSLTLLDLPKVVKLPKGIGCLSSLQSLRITHCEKIKRMPEEMRHLTSLTKLHIGGCIPELTKECENKTGANWSNIQHIPDIKLGLASLLVLYDALDASIPGNTWKPSDTKRVGLSKTVLIFDVREDIVATVPTFPFP